MTIAANLNDSALRVASLIHRSSRAGRPAPTELDAEQSVFIIEASNKLGFDQIKVNPDDIPKLPKTSHAFRYEDSARLDAAEGGAVTSRPGPAERTPIIALLDRRTSASA